MTVINFDATQVAPNAGFDTVPVDWYKMMMDESERKPTKDGSGEYLWARFTILEGVLSGTRLQGRKVFKNFNLKNNSEEAVKIGRGELSALCHAVGVLQAADSSQLHNIPFWGRVKIKPAEGAYDDQNTISSFKHVNDPPSAAVVASGTPGVSGAPSGFTPPPAPGPFIPPAAPTPPAPPPPPAPPAWPPVGWTAHPTAPGYFYKDNEVKAEADLRALVQTYAPPAPPAAPAAPGAWVPPAGGQPWNVVPPANAAPAPPPAPPAAPAAPHPTQTAAPPWHRPAG